MTPLIALEGAGKAAEELVPVMREIAHEFGFTSEEDFLGLYEAIVLVYSLGYPTVHNLNVLIKQVQNYLEQLGSEVKKAEVDVQKGLSEIPHIHWQGLKGI